MELDIRVTKTFYDWCIEHNRMDLNDRFDVEKNRCTTKDIGYSSNSKYWFKCPRGLHDSEQYVMYFVTRNIGRVLICHKCNSVAQFIVDQFGESYLWDHWLDDNALSPWEISHASTRINVKLQCAEKDYHKYEQRASLFSNGAGCPYCTRKMVHPNDSLSAIYPEVIDRWSSKNDKNPWEYAPHSDKKVWLKCPIGIHNDYEQIISNAVEYDFRCKECSLEESRKPNDLVGMVFGRLVVKCLDTDGKQTIDRNGRIKYRWLCECSCGNPEFKSVLACHLTSGKIRSCGCLTQENCSQLQLKVENYIQDNFDYESIKHEYNCSIIAINPNTKRQLPYDNEVIFSNGKILIIEVMGESHYKIDLLTIKNAKKRKISPEQTLSDLKWRDEYKKQYAISKGYQYLAIPYWTENDESYKILIDQKIKEILTIQN